MAVSVAVGRTARFLRKIFEIYVVDSVLLFYKPFEMVALVLGRVFGVRGPPRASKIESSVGKIVLTHET
jgi:hypothetical protein